jgi:hypothetical protein
MRNFNAPTREIDPRKLLWQLNDRVITLTWQAQSAEAKGQSSTALRREAQDALELMKELTGEAQKGN